MVDIGDDRTCRSFIRIVSAHYPDWPLRAKLEEGLKTVKVRIVDKEEPETLPIHLKRLDWSLLADTLLNTYKKRLKWLARRAHLPWLLISQYSISKLEPAWALDEDDDEPDFAADKQYLGQPVHIALNVQNTPYDDESNKPGDEETPMEDAETENEKKDEDDKQGDNEHDHESKQAGEPAEESSTQEYDTPPATLDHDVSMEERRSSISAAEDEDIKTPFDTPTHERTDDDSVMKPSDDDGAAGDSNTSEKQAASATEPMDVDSQEGKTLTASTSTNPQAQTQPQADTAAESSQPEQMSDTTGSLATALDMSFPLDTESAGAEDETKDKEGNPRSPLKRQRGELGSDDEDGDEAEEEETEDKRSTLR